MTIRRRVFLQSGLIVAAGGPLWAALRQESLDGAARALGDATESGQIAAAVLHVQQKDQSFTKTFGAAVKESTMFLLGSISKPITVTALLTLLDQGQFKLEDRLQKFLPAFRGEGRDDVTLKHLLTHTSGLPDQLSENEALRGRHAPLAEFVRHAVHTPLSFAPGTRYQYSSMGILLASRVAELISGIDILAFVDRAVFRPLAMKHSAQGLGRFLLSDLVRVQTEFAAPEAGGGDPAARNWDWNSAYWRRLGAPWGGTHASAPDLGLFLAELLGERGVVLKPATARLMTTNQNPAGFTPRGLGMSVGTAAGGTGCSERTFGHTGSTGTIAWADPASETTCVVLTSLPARASMPHPRDLASARVAAAAS